MSDTFVNWENHLEALGRLLLERDQCHTLIIVGRMAMVRLGYDRIAGTADVDAAAQVVDGKLIPGKPFPESLKAAVDRHAPRLTGEKHLEDLKALEPSAADFTTFKKWITANDPHPSTVLGVAEDLWIDELKAP